MRWLLRPSRYRPARGQRRNGVGLAPLLGAGQTHEQGYHRKTVEAGLRYLLDHQGPNGSFHEDQGTMYSHGLATLVLCESLAMTRSDPGGASARYRRQPELRQAAQRAIDFIVRHQHSGGGWRYVPGEKGRYVRRRLAGHGAAERQDGRPQSAEADSGPDVPVSGFGDGRHLWRPIRLSEQLTHVPAPARSACSVACTWVGIVLTRASSPARTYLDGIGPSANNVYFNYYATQVMHHYGGPLWEKWHPLLRDHLVDTQERAGHPTGSWYFDGDFGSIVGRSTLYHRDVDHDSGSLLPAHADLFGVGRRAGSGARSAGVNRAGREPRTPRGRAICAWGKPLHRP